MCTCSSPHYSNQHSHNHVITDKNWIKNMFYCLRHSLLNKMLVLYYDNLILDHISKINKFKFLQNIKIQEYRRKKYKSTCTHHKLFIFWYFYFKDNAYACDPRIQKFIDDEKEKKLAQKRAKQEAARHKAEEGARVSAHLNLCSSL